MRKIKNIIRRGKKECVLVLNTCDGTETFQFRGKD